MDQPKYRIEIFWSDEDGGYIANVPDLRYCSAFGESYEEALREVLVAVELHLDTLKEFGHSIPEPDIHQQDEITDQAVEQAARVFAEQVRESYEALTESNRAAIEGMVEAQREQLRISQEASQEIVHEALEAYTRFLNSMFSDYRSGVERSEKGSEARRRA